MALACSVGIVQSIYLPGLLPRSYLPTDHLFVMISSHLSNLGHHRVVEFRNRPTFAKTEKSKFSLGQPLLPNFPICGINEDHDGIRSQIAGFIGSD